MPILEEMEKHGDDSDPLIYVAQVHQSVLRVLLKVENSSFMGSSKIH